MNLRTFVLSLILSLAALAWAQPLANLAPADSALSLSWSFQGGVFDSLGDDLAALPWEQGKATAAKLLRVLAQASDEPDMAELWRTYADVLSGEREASGVANWFGMEDVLALCPAYQEVLEASPQYQERYPEGAPSEGLFTISLSPFSPVPVLTALIRVDEGLAPFYQQTFDVLLECAQNAETEVTQLEQDGIPLYVLGNASDFPVVVGADEGLFFAGSNLEVLRGVLRRAGGADEASLADSRLYQEAAARFGDPANSLGLSLDFGVLGSAVDTFGGTFGVDEGLSYLLERGSAMLHTLGGLSAQLSANEDGLLSESLLLPDPEGGDEALLELLRCAACSVSAPRLAPAEAVGVSVTALPWREVWAYLEDWLTGLEAATGESFDLKALLRDEFDFDLDVALFDWLGSEAHSLVLGSVGTDLRTLLYNPPQVLAVPVSSPEAAQAGLEEWGSLLGPLLDMALSADEMMNDMIPGPDLDPSFGGDEFGVEDFASVYRSDYDYADVPLTRLRVGPTTDLAYGFLGNYLVVGTPASALEPVIDTYQGAASFTESADYRSFRSGLPERVSGLSYRDDRAQLEGLRDLLAALVQPLAFASDLGLKAWLEDLRDEDRSSAEDDSLEDDTFDAGDDFYPYDAYLEGVVPLPLEVPGEASGELAYSGYISDYFELSEVEAGQKVEVFLDSPSFLPYLALLDADSGAYLAVAEPTGDDASTVSFIFEAEAGVTYWLEASSVSGYEAGSYSLTVNVLNNPVLETMPLTTDGSLGYLSNASSLTPQVLSGTGSVAGELTDSAGDAASTYYYELSGLEPGDEFEVTLRSEDFDTYLALIDAEASLYLDNNDDAEAMSTDSALSFTAEAGVTYWLEVSSFDDSGGSFTLNVSEAGALERFRLSLVTPEALSVPGELSGSLAAGGSDYVELSGLTPGTEVRVDLSSREFDTYLALLDADSGAELLENDDAGDGTDSSLNFTVEPEVRYWLEVRAFDAMSSGAYDLRVQPGSARAELPSAEDLPSFGELLDFFDLVPQAVGVLAEHLSSSESYRQQDERGIYSRSLTRIRW